jgi:hypothetical protein
MSVFTQCLVVFSALSVVACGADPVPQAIIDASSPDGEIIDGGLQDFEPVDEGPRDAGAVDASAPVSQCAAPNWTLTSSRLIIECADAKVTLTPSIHSAGVWRDPTNCRANGADMIECTFSGFGRLEVTIAPPHITSRYIADVDHEFGGHGLKGVGILNGADAWLSNGFQSWSQSGVIAIPTRVTSGDLETALRASGDVEVIRDGTTHSWWHTFVHADTSLVAGVISAERLRSWITVSGTAPNLSLRLASGGAGESMQIPSGRVIEGETWFIDLASELNTSLDEYGRSLPTRARSRARPEAGWNSWYQLWDTVDEDAVRANAGLVAEHLTGRIPPDLLPLRIVIDDGWQAEWGDWTANAKFPNGLQGLASDLRADGFNTGIWVAPLLVKADLPLVAEHPDWFVDDASFTHLRHGLMKILDVTHPGAADHLQAVIRRLVGHGFNLLKLDFLFAGSFEGERLQRLTGMEAYNRALELIREAAGADTIILAVGAPPIAGFEQLDVWRLGPDVAVQVFDASWYFIPSVGRSTAARWVYCRSILCDGDPVLLRQLDQNEATTGSWAAAFSGSALFLSDDLRTLPLERWDWLTPAIVETALSGEPSTPEPIPSIVPRQLTTGLADQSARESRHRVPVQWSLPNGGTVHVNWSDDPIEHDGERYSRRSAHYTPPSN